jgi:hypothetical protein
MHNTAMSDLSELKVASMRERVSREEWETRVDLAACYRLVHHYGMDDLVYNHISARVLEWAGLLRLVERRYPGFRG